MADQQNSNLPAEIMIIAAEASSSLYAQRLLEHWQSQHLDVHAFGIGSRAMENAGFEIIGRSEDLAVVGLQEVIVHFKDIKFVFEKLVSEAERRRPRFALLLDYPDFNLRLAKKLKALDIKVIYYISPQVWAWRTGRVKTIRKYVDRMLVLFPFEVDFFKRYEVPVDFVGHPALDELTPALFNADLTQEHRHRFSLGDQDIVVGLMPGSRRSEIKHNLQTQLLAAQILVKRNPLIKPVILVAPSLERSFIQDLLRESAISVQIIREPPLEMIRVCDYILCASGTATLMVGLMEKPMVIMYRMNPITAFLAKRLVRNTPFFGMVNLIMGERVVPELFQEDANPVRLADEIEAMIQNSDQSGRVRLKLRDLKERLGSQGATLRVAEILAEFLPRASVE